MPRVALNKVDFFPHDTNSNKMTLNILFNRFQHVGYYCWFSLLERLGASDHHFIDISTPIGAMELIESIFKVPYVMGWRILCVMREIEAIDNEFFEHGIIYSENFIKRLKPVYDKRQNNTLSRDELISHLKEKKKWNNEPTEYKKMTQIVEELIKKEVEEDIQITPIPENETESVILEPQAIANETEPQTHVSESETIKTEENVVDEEKTEEPKNPIAETVVAQSPPVSESEKGKMSAKKERKKERKKESNNITSVQKKSKIKKEFEDDSWQMLFAMKFYQDLKKVVNAISEPSNFQSWAKEFDMIHRITVKDTSNGPNGDRRLERIKHVYRYLCSIPVYPGGKFSWRKVTLSPSSFRKNFPTLDAESGWKNEIDNTKEKVEKFAYATD